MHPASKYFLPNIKIAYVTSLEEIKIDNILGFYVKFTKYKYFGKN